ncbi:unnamed protein product [Acidithrix sp. C25]|nr:unnamed protein product [Acidithrix sp. C25]
MSTQEVIEYLQAKALVVAILVDSNASEQLISIYEIAKAHNIKAIKIGTTPNPQKVIEGSSNYLCYPFSVEEFNGAIEPISKKNSPKTEAPKTPEPPETPDSDPFIDLSDLHLGFDEQSFLEGLESQTINQEQFNPILHESNFNPTEIDSFDYEGELYNFANTTNPIEQKPQPQSRTFAVLGVGGSGASTTSMAIAQALAQMDSTLLIDMKADGDIGMYHDVDRAHPGLGELMVGARKSELTATYLRNFYIQCLERRYVMIVGTKRQEDTLAARENDLRSLIDKVTEEFNYVVFDIDNKIRAPRIVDAVDPDPTVLGSEVALALADRVIITLSEDLRGIHGALRLLHRVLSLGTPIACIALVVCKSNRTIRRSSNPQHSQLERLCNQVCSEFILHNEPNTSKSRRNLKVSPDNAALKIFTCGFERNLESIHESIRPLPKGLYQPLMSWLAREDTPKQTKSEPKVNLRRIMPGELASDGIN